MVTVWYTIWFCNCQRKNCMQFEGLNCNKFALAQGADYSKLFRRNMKLSVPLPNCESAPLSEIGSVTFWSVQFVQCSYFSMPIPWLKARSDHIKNVFSIFFFYFLGSWMAIYYSLQNEQLMIPAKNTNLPVWLILIMVINIICTGCKKREKKISQTQC